MKRRAPRRPPNGDSAPHVPPANHCRAVVRVDGTAIRKKFKRDYEKAVRDLDLSRQQLDQFHQTDQPQFTRWLNTHFGALLTELRELGPKLAAADELIFMVQDEVMFGGGSHARAYQRIMELRNNPEPPPRPPKGGSEPDGEWDPFGAGPEFENAGGEADPFEALFNELNELFGEFTPGEGARNERGSRPGRRTEAATPAHATARLKELYRTLVRRLHPDSQREMTAQKTEWWHQAQAAYEAGDVEQLEVILTLCDIGDSGTTAHTSATLLQRITAQLKSSLRALKRQLTERRRDPAWNFSRRADQAAMADQMRRALTGDLQIMRDRWRHTQELIAKWQAAAERLQPPRRRKRQPPNSGFPF